MAMHYLQNGQMSSEAVRNLITNSGTYCKHTADLSQPDSNQSLYQWFGCDCKIGKCGYCRNNFTTLNNKTKG